MDCAGVTGTDLPAESLWCLGVDTSLVGDMACFDAGVDGWLRISCHGADGRSLAWSS